MADRAPQDIRERVWVEKVDKSGDTPVVLETVFVEQHNGVVTTVRTERPDQPKESA